MRGTIKVSYQTHSIAMQTPDGVEVVGAVELYNFSLGRQTSEDIVKELRDGATITLTYLKFPHKKVKMR